MATSTDRVGPNFRNTIVKASGVRIADALARDTTDYAEIIVGDGVPSGGYGRHSGATLVYLRKDASSADAAAYVSVNGGTAWSPLQTTGAGGTQADLIFDAATELTIATGAITATQGYHTIDTEADAASDDLDSIAGGTAGEVVVVRPADAARTVVLKHGVGANLIACLGGRDISLAEANDTAILVYNGTQWVAFGSTLLDNVLGTANTWTAEQTFSAGAAFLDSDAITLGTGDDDTISHDGTLTTWTHTTGDLVIDSTDVDDQIILRVGTDTTATGIEFRNNSDAAVWKVEPTSATAGRLMAADGSALILGAGSDDSVAHDGTDTLWTHTTGDWIFDSTDVDDPIAFRLGTDTSATAWQVRNDSDTVLFSVNGAGAGAMVGTLTTTDGVASGDARRIGGKVACIVADGTAHTNSTDEAVLASYTIPANTIKSGTVVKVKWQARATVDNAGTTLTGRLRLGGTTLTGTELVTTTAVDTAAGHLFCGEFTLVGRAAPGAAAECVGTGSFALGAAATAMGTAGIGATNFATNAALLLELTGDWSAADANAVVAEVFVVEVVG